MCPGFQIRDNSYIMMRQKQVTPEAREAQVLANFPVAAWREGASHHPIEAYILAPRTARHLHTQRDQHHTGFDRDALMQDLRTETPSPVLQAPRLEAAQNIIDENNANEVLLQAAQRHYPPPLRQSHPPDQPEALANCAKHMWAIFRQMKAQSRTAQGTLIAWGLWVRFQQAHGIHKQRSRRRNKEKRDDLYLCRRSRPRTRGTPMVFGELSSN